MSDAENISIVGQGEAITFITVKGMSSSDKGIINLLRATNIAIEHISFDYEYKPFFQGEVTYVNGGLISTKQIGSNQVSIQKLLSSRSGFGTVYDSGNFGVRKSNTGTQFSTSAKPAMSYNSSNERFYFNYSGLGTQVINEVNNWVEVGDHFVFTARKPANAIRFRESSNISVKSITIHASPASAIVGVLNTDTQVFDDINIVPASGYIISSNADGFHIQDSQSAVEIKNSKIQSSGDDGIAIYNAGMTMNSQSGAAYPNSFSVKKSDYGVPLSRVKVGQILQFVDPISNTLLLNSRVEAITRSSSYDYIRVKSSLFDKLPAGNYDIKNYNLSLDGSNSIVTGNTIESVRRAGVNLKSRNAMVSSNVFTNVDLWGIAAHVENSALTSSPLPSGHIISDNIFNGISPRSNQISESANIRIGLFTGTSDRTYPQPNTNLLGNSISNNSFNNSALNNTIKGSYQ